MNWAQIGFCKAGLVAPDIPKESNPIARKQTVDLFLRITAARKDWQEFLHIGDGIEVARGLFGAEATVEVGADATMAGSTQKLADMVDMIGYRFQCRVGQLLEGRDFALPAWIEHPGVEGSADHSVALGDRMDHFVG